MDMMNIKSHQQCLNLVLSHFKTLDVLVNNAGRSQRAVWNEIDLAVDRELFELDVFAVINLSRMVLNYFINNSVHGHLAVTSSSAGLIGAPMSGSYTGAKHALHVSLENFSKFLRIELIITLSKGLLRMFTKRNDQQIGYHVVLSWTDFFQFPSRGSHRTGWPEIRSDRSSGGQTDDRRKMWLFVCGSIGEQNQIELGRRVSNQFDHVHWLLLSQREKIVSTQ
jgi:short chain dehydrogenase